MLFLRLGEALPHHLNPALNPPPYRGRTRSTRPCLRPAPPEVLHRKLYLSRNPPPGVKAQLRVTAAVFDVCYFEGPSRYHTASLVSVEVRHLAGLGGHGAAGGTWCSGRRRGQLRVAQRADGAAA